jgi:predicted KAP-like P-loop ATPase
VKADSGSPLLLGEFRKLVSKLAAQRSVCVLIDDLDRCLPEAALEVFEAAKLFLDAPECTYVMALDRDVIRRGLAVRYKGQNAGLVDPDEYIEKTITLSFDVPPLGRNDAIALLKGCLETASFSESEWATTRSEWLVSR